MTEETQSVTGAVNGLLRTAQNQLENTLKLIQAQVPHVNDAVAAEAEDYNQMVELVGKLEDKVASLELQLHSKDEAATADKAEMQDEINVLNAKIGKLNIAINAAATMKAELKKLKAMNPERLAAKNKELRTNLKEKTDLLVDTSRKLKTTKNELREANTQVGILTHQNSEMINEIDEYRAKRKTQNGDVVQRVYNNGSDLDCYVNVFEWGLTYKTTTVTAMMLNDLTWHIEVRTTIGLGIIISITKWLTPFFPYVAEEVSNNWPKDLNRDLVSIIIERCQDSHPHLVDRVDWASSTPLSEIEGLQEKHLDMLSESGINSLFAVVSTPQERLPNLVKGMGRKTAAQVYEVCNKAVEAWESENWTPEERHNMQ